MHKPILLLTLAVVIIASFVIFQYPIIDKTDPLVLDESPPGPPAQTSGTPDNPNLDYISPPSIKEVYIGKPYLVAGSKSVTAGEFDIFSTGEKISSLNIGFYTSTIHDNPLLTNCHLFEGNNPLGSNMIDPLPSAKYDYKIFQANFAFKELSISSEDIKRITIRCDVAEDPPAGAVYSWRPYFGADGVTYGIINKWSMIIDDRSSSEGLRFKGFPGEINVPVGRISFYVSSDSAKLLTLSMPVFTRKTDMGGIDGYSMWDGNKKVAEGSFNDNGQLVIDFKEEVILPQEEYKTLILKVDIAPEARPYDGITFSYNFEKEGAYINAVGVSSGQEITPITVDNIRSYYIMICSRIPEENEKVYSGVYGAC